MIIFLFLMILSILMIVLGLLIWKKEMVELIHDYNRQNVKDIKGYTTAMGKAVLSIGILIFVFDIISIIKWIPESIDLIVLFLGLIVILATMLKIQKKYNGGIF